MKESFPNVRPFRNGDRIGFHGTLLVRGRLFRVQAIGTVHGYPSIEPRVYISPHPEEHHWYRTGGEPYLCYQRNRVWQPGRSTFASCIAVAVRYLQEYGG